MDPLPWRPLGSTGLSVTPIGFGLAAVGRPGYINLGREQDLGPTRSVEAMERRAHEILDAAHDGGVRYFDAARSYGLAEAFLASWLKARALPPDAVTVGSKWGYIYVGDWRTNVTVHEVKDHSLETLRRQIGESRELLGDHLDLYQIHSATLESGVLDDNSVLTVLNELRGQGLVIGLTTSGPRQGEVIRRALQVDVGGVNPFACVQSTWNVLEPSAGSALAEAHDRGWGVIVKEALANGRLTSHSSGPERLALEPVAARHHTTIDALALAAVLAQPWVDVALSGAVTVEQLRSNLAAVRLRLTEKDLDEIAQLAESPDHYWTTRSKLPWN
jgi:aryl-alcohol dehydrogenase-like predicted oxidoreductase